MDLLDQAVVECDETEDIYSRFRDKVRNKRDYGARGAHARLSLSVKLVAVFILCKPNMDDAAVSFLNRHCMSALKSALNYEFDLGDVQSWVHTATHNVDFRQAEQNNNHYIAVRANKHMAEHMTYSKLFADNTKGIPVPSRSVLEQYMANIPITGRGEKMLAHVASIGNKIKKRERWLRCFRKRWAVEYRDLKPRKHVALKIKQKQADA